ncbi:GNAT family N-acetyltransferase [Deinococcus sp.]|uniref:GNAT family N-acetyltransferase n=1 Tax=Deinococcus sp. TaxID=47478 RepID=UPI003B58CAC5
MPDMPAPKLRPLRPADEEFCRAADWTLNLAPDKVREHWAEIIAGRGKLHPDFLRLGVKLDGELVGDVDLAYLTAQSGEFGIQIERPRWRQGIGLAAGKLLLAHALEVLRASSESDRVSA